MQYNFVVPSKTKTVTVITPTVGSDKLQDAIKSVKDQTYEHINHLVVVDGYDFFYKVTENVDPTFLHKNLNLTTAPQNTGANGFYGHRIYAAYPHLIDTDYVFLLDEDNWYKPDHVETLVKTLQDGNDFAYSLREIYDENKNYICDDNCESLGKWPIWFTHDNPQYLIDTSSFAFHREFLIKVCQLWHSGWGGDRRFYSHLRSTVKHNTSGKHTLCYRLDGNPNSVKADFFEQGNEEQHKRYEGKFPWLR